MFTDFFYLLNTSIYSAEQKPIDVRKKNVNVINSGFTSLFSTEESDFQKKSLNATSPKLHQISG